MSADVVTDIFNMTLSQERVPTYFKTATIVSVPNSFTGYSLNKCRPVALIPILSKCFDKLALQHIKWNIPESLDPHQFEFKRNRSKEAAIFPLPLLSLYNKHLHENAVGVF